MKISDTEANRRRAAVLGLLGLLGLLALVVGVGLAAAAAGDLDSTFGGDGLVVTQIGDRAFANAVAVQPDGQKIVAAGYWERLDDTGFGLAWDGIALARYNLDGSLNTSFATGGVYANHRHEENGRLYDAIVLPDNSIWATGRLAGWTFTGTDGACMIVHGRPVVAHIASDGSLLAMSTALWLAGPGGVRGCPQPITGFAGWLFQAIAVQADGKIVAAGYRYDDVDASQTPDFVAARFTAAGSLDASFGSGGVVTLDVSAGLADYGFALAIQPDGKIVIAGRTDGTPGVHALALVRLLADGSLDSGFGTAGRVVVDGAAGYSLALQPDGKILVGGNVNGGFEFGVSRFLPNGAVDATFGSGGTTQLGLNGYAYGIARQVDGKVVAAGETTASRNTVVRFDASGLPDPTFGNAGLVATTFPDSCYPEPYRDVALQPDAKIVAATSIGSPCGNYGFALGRYANDVIATTPTTTAITSDSPDPSTVGGAVTVQYQVTATGGGIPTGQVTVTDGTASCTATVAAGQCSLTFATAGTKSLTASYAGDATFLGSTSTAESHNVNPANIAPTMIDEEFVACVPAKAKAPVLPKGSATLTDPVDPDSSPKQIRISVVTQPSFGEIALHDSKGAFTYTPTAPSTTDSFTVRATDGVSFGNIATITLRAVREASCPKQRTRFH